MPETRGYIYHWKFEHEMADGSSFVLMAVVWPRSTSSREEATSMSVRYSPYKCMRRPTHTLRLLFACEAVRAQVARHRRLVVEK